MVISGSGNVAIYANQKATELGAQGHRHVRLQRLHRTIENGIDYKVMQEIKEVKRDRIKDLR